MSTASQAAADARGRAGHQSAAASNLSGLSLQEARQILNITKLSPEEVQKVRPPVCDGVVVHRQAEEGKCGSADHSHWELEKPQAEQLKK